MQISNSSTTGGFNRWTLTELGGGQNPLVEQNDAGTQGNPQTEDTLAIDS